MRHFCLTIYASEVMLVFMSYEAAFSFHLKIHIKSHNLSVYTQNSAHPLTLVSSSSVMHNWSYILSF